MVKGKDILNWLECLIENSPERRSGEEDYRFMLRQIENTVNLNEERDALIWALKKWIESKDNFRAPFAIEVAVKYHLIELVPDIKKFLEIILKREPYFASTVEKALNELNKKVGKM